MASQTYPFTEWAAVTVSATIVVANLQAALPTERLMIKPCRVTKVTARKSPLSSAPNGKPA